MFFLFSLGCRDTDRPANSVCGAKRDAVRVTAALGANQ
jgi:hypothetical protein